jgi:cellobiose-specific phosphotransferase system component IIC
MVEWVMVLQVLCVVCMVTLAHVPLEAAWTNPAAFNAFIITAKRWRALHEQAE